MKKQILMLTLLTGLVGNSVQAASYQQPLVDIIKNHPRTVLLTALTLAIPTIGSVNKVRGWLFEKIESTNASMFGEDYKQFGFGVVFGVVVAGIIVDQLNRLTK